MGEEGPGHSRDRHSQAFQYLLDLKRARAHDIWSVGTAPDSLLISDRTAEVVVIGKHICTLELQFSANPTVCLLHCPSRPANHVHVGGVLALFAQ